MNKITLAFFQAKNKTTIKGLLLLFAFLFLNTQASWGQVNITPVRTDVSGFATWTDTGLAGTTYLQLLTASSQTISPAMDFDGYTGETLNFKARTFGTITSGEHVITVWISIDNGANWTNLGTVTPTSGTMTAQTPFNISSYSGTQVKIKFTVGGTSNTIGVGIDDISITGIVSSSGPEINIKGNAVSIVDGATPASTSNATDFGTVATSTNVTKTYTIENTGSADLVLTSPFVQKSLGLTEFTITQPTLTTIPAGSSTTFSVAFNSSTAGTFNENIEVLCNDTDEGVYNYAIKAIAEVPTPNIAVKGNNINIVSGDSTPSATDLTDFGTSIINTSSSKNFTIENAGTGPLTVNSITMNTGTSYTIAGIALPATIAVGGFTTFTINFNSLVAGTFTDTVIITNDDPTDSSYTFRVTAKAVPLNFGVGDISIIAMTTDVPDSFSFVNWVPIPVDAEIIFTDNAFEAGALKNNENSLIWKNNTGTTISIGTVILINDTPLTDLGTIVSGNLNGLSSSSENLFIYEGSASSPNFIYGLSNLSWITSGTANTNNSYLPTALNTTNGNIVTGDSDNVEYSGTLSPKDEKSSFIAYKILVNDPANWTKNNTYFALNSIDFELASVWETAAWTDGLTPTLALKTVINDTYGTSTNGTFTAKKLTVNSGKSLTINSGTNLTIQNEIINNGTVTLENNANLIQVNNTSNTGEITVNRNGASLMLLDYSLWSSPVSGQKLKAFSPNTLDNRFYTYNSTTNIYVPVAAPATTDFASGNGYLIRVPNDHPTTPTIWSGIFRGVPNNGNISVPGLTSGTFNAVGNPYPSTISADAFITVNNLTEPLYFWRKTNAATGTAYATYTMAGAVGTPGNGGITPNGTIQVGQGFIVKTTSNSVAFANTMRTANNSNQILKTTTTEKNRIWLNLSKGTEPVNQMMVAYMDGATSEIDNTLDGKYINDNETALTSSLKGEEFVIQAKGLPFDSGDIVPLSFKTELAGSFTIAIDKVDGLFLGNQEIVLKDLKAGTEQNLKTGSYTFTSEAGTFKNRFEIAFKNNQTLDINTPYFDENSVIVFNQNGTLNVSTGKNAIKNIRVFDIRGVLIAEQKEVNANTASIKNVTASKQAVLIQITSEDNKTVTKKAIF
ncbi:MULTISPECIES: choice-of-anchor D domain-containing protein [unclassified Flavobacterium]|uniref:choice-of-anchor D domain-containing protein n=1 Tax=unclassified Flavobacterium TaxID=196869 RepID=UPI00131B6364|nr:MULTISPECIES: choice-of-anchor D domain-containing protein [unclassified Flavobacterium]